MQETYGMIRHPQRSQHHHYPNYLLRNVIVDDLGLVSGCGRGEIIVKTVMLECRSSEIWFEL